MWSESGRLSLLGLSIVKPALDVHSLPLKRGSLYLVNLNRFLYFFVPCNHKCNRNKFVHIALIMCANY